DEQAKAGSAPAPLVAAPELPEHPCGELGRHTLTLVAHGHGNPPLDRLDFYGDRAAAVPHRVFQQVTENLVDFVLIEPHLGELAADHELEPVRGLAGGDPALDEPAGALGD